MTALRTAIVTGGARGIGAEIARGLAADGYRVAILDLLDEPGRSTAAAIGGVFVQADVGDVASARAAMAEAIADLGGVGVLVNSAGILGKGPLIDIDADDWDRVLRINARGTLLTMQSAAADMIERGTPGRIVNIASMAAKRGGAGEAHYAASKAAVVALTRAGATEWGPHGITVNALCPGYVLTEMGAATRSAHDVEAWTALSPLGRLGTPDDVAAITRFLVSDGGSYFTGQALDVSGGMVMQ
ncbi:SDR family NAD(P)-dependent oxidoreductase [uncultured Amnibacterium sp.]|uniref:SDR family NAD(P)-dependent oxidoreductase n=1 Tax=uncultured Amnibacterium sp. TaxID=1631851 RepID=UPI0035CBC64D